MFRKLLGKYGTFEAPAAAAASPGLEESINSLEAQLSVLRREQRRQRPQAERVFLWELKSRPWALCAKAAIRLGQSVAALVLVYWSLGVNREHLMPCDSRHLPIVSLFACEYTKAFLRVFTLLAVNIALALAMRMILQERIYYGMLKAWGLIDFADSVPLRDPLLWVLVVSLLHGLSHFALKYANSEARQTDTLTDDFHLAQEVAQAFVGPAAVFMMLFYASFDIEATLIPLNKYFEEDWDYAKNALGSITPMDERVLQRLLEERDVVGELEERTVLAAYGRLVELYPEYEAAPAQAHFWFAELWPAQLLLDPRLADAESRSFRCMFGALLVVAATVHGATMGALSVQAFKDIYYDACQGGQREDALSGAVICVHVAFIACLLWKCVARAGLCRLSTCCMSRPKEPCH